MKFQLCLLQRLEASVGFQGVGQGLGSLHSYSVPTQTEKHSGKWAAELHPGERLIKLEPSIIFLTFLLCRPMTDEIDCLPGLKTTICNELLCAQCSAEIKCKWESQRAHAPDAYFVFFLKIFQTLSVHSSRVFFFAPVFLAQRCSVGGNCILIVASKKKKKLIILLVKFLKGYDKPIKKILR